MYICKYVCTYVSTYVHTCTHSLAICTVDTVHTSTIHWILVMYATFDSKAPWDVVLIPTDCWCYRATFNTAGITRLFSYSKKCWDYLNGTSRWFYVVVVRICIHRIVMNTNTNILYTYDYMIT